jgi:hypothetical protein
MSFPKHDRLVVAITYAPARATSSDKLRSPQVNLYMPAERTFGVREAVLDSRVMWRSH